MNAHLLHQPDENSKTHPNKFSKQTNFIKEIIQNWGMGLGKQPNKISFQVNIHRACFFLTFVFTIHHMHTVRLTIFMHSTFPALCMRNIYVASHFAKFME